MMSCPVAAWAEVGRATSERTRHPGRPCWWPGFGPRVGGSLPYVTYRPVKHAPELADRLTEFFIHACGPAAEGLAEHFAECVRVWDREVREPFAAHTHVRADGPEPFDALTHYLDRCPARLLPPLGRPRRRQGALNPPPRHRAGPRPVRARRALG